MVNLVKERELFESKYRFNSDLKYLVYCLAQNKYKPNDENKKMHIVQTMADRANSHFETWLASSQREGFKLVPLQPTNNMAHVGKEIDGRLSAFKCGDIYKAMIGACDE